MNCVNCKKDRWSCDCGFETRSWRQRAKLNLKPRNKPFEDISSAVKTSHADESIKLDTSASESDKYTDSKYWDISPADDKALDVNHKDYIIQNIRIELQLLKDAFNERINKIDISLLYLLDELKKSSTETPSVNNLSTAFWDVKDEFKQ